MKKNILFICCEMGKGGVSKSLASLLNCIDYEKYSIDLYLFDKKGVFLNQIPDKVNILEENKPFIYHIKKGKLFSVIRAVLALMQNKNEKCLEKKWSRYWKANKKLFTKCLKKYDVAIAYNDGVELYYLVDCVKANKKIAYNHIDYTNNLTYKPGLDVVYYQKIDALVTVSNICAQQLKKVFPQFSDKVHVIENIVQKDIIMGLAGNRDPFFDIVQDRQQTKIIVTVAGLYMRKGFDLMADALNILKQEGELFKWFIIGVGPEEVQIKEIIYSAGIDENTVFMHEQSNPYQYVKWADIFALTSYAEGKSIAVEEAKLLEKPILITNYSSAGDQIEKDRSGLIANMQSDSVYHELKRLISDAELCQSLSNYLSKHCFSNEIENMEKIYRLWDF